MLLGDELVAAPPPVEVEPPPPEPPPPAVPLDDDPPCDCDPDEPELPCDFVGLVTLGGGTDGTVTVGVRVVGTLTCGTVTVTGGALTVTDGTVTPGTVTPGVESVGDALLVSGSTASGTMKPRAAATPATSHRNRPRACEAITVPRPRDDVRVLRPRTVRALNLPGIVAEL